MTDSAPAHSALEGFPLSPQQRRAWTLQASGDPGVEIRLRVSGVPEAAVRDALAALVGRFEILRTTFPRLPGMTAPLQVVHGDAPVLWETGTPDAVAEAVRQPVDGAGLRAGLAPSGDGVAVVFYLSSLRADAASAGTLAAALQDALRGVEPDQEPLQYPDLADWLNETLDGEGAEEGRAFWREQMPEGAPDTAARPAAEASRWAAVSVPFADGLGARVHALAERLGVSGEAVALVVWQDVVGRRAEVGPVGVAFDGRAFEELKDAVGPLTRVAPLVALGAGAPFDERVRAVAAGLAEGASWQDTFNWETTTGDASAQTPFSFSWTAFPAPSSEEPAVTVERVTAPTDAGLAHLTVTAAGSAFDGRLVFDTDALDAVEAERLAGHVAALLGAAIERPEAPLSEHSVLTEVDRATLDAFATEGAAVGPAHATLHALVEAQAATTPQATAVIGRGGSLTYADLDARANRLARHLQEQGVGPEVRVALLLERSPDAIVAVLAVLKAGGAYVPLDASYPPERLAFVLDDADARLVVTRSSAGTAPPDGVPVVDLDHDAEAIAAHPSEPVEGGAGAGSAAYVIYTSGSTGRPKGVVVEHGQATHSTAARRAVYAEPVGAYLLLPSLAFDSSVAGLFWTLSTGGALVVPHEDEAADPRALARLVAAHGVTHVLGVPSLYGLLLDHPASLATLRTCIVAGEACPPGLVERHAERLPHARLFNEYGPTEATVWSTVYDTAAWPSDRERTATVPIGRPIPGARVVLLDDAGPPVPPGAEGEICVGGSGVARGYLGRPALTAERFVTGADGERLYRTGDRGRFLADGTLLFLGRTDGQVKLRGYRVELGEIEAVLSEHAAVTEAAVALREGGPGGDRLIAYAVPDAEPARRALAAERPLYALPNGMRVAHQNAAETDYLYREIFEDQSYFRHGVGLDDGAVVLDVGANIGLFSLLVTQSVPGARVLAFEPIPETADALRANAALYDGDLQVAECALGAEGGEAEFSYFPHVSLVSGRYADGADERQAIRAFLRPSGDGAPDDARLESLLDSRLESRPVQVAVRTVSDVIRDEGLDRIDLLKIDVEKSEIDVLRGIAGADWPLIRQVTMEVQDTGGALAQVREILDENGFHVAVEQEDELGGTPLVKVYAVRGADDGDHRLAPSVPAWSDPDALGADLRAHAERRLPPYMVPDAVVVLGGLPRTPNGKLDRDALPAPPQPDAVADFEEPAAGTEARLAAVWAAVLGVDRVGRHDDFFERGGHSLLAIKLFARIEEAFGAAPPLASLFSAPTVARLAPVVEAAVGGGETTGEMGPSLVPLQPEGSGPVLFCFHNAHNQILLYTPLARAIGAGQRVVHVQGQGHDGREITDADLGQMADAYLAQIRALQPEGPYLLAGFCVGGRLAVEVGRRLLAAGETVGLLAILESVGAETRLPSRREKYSRVVRRLLSRRGLAEFDPRDPIRWLRAGAARRKALARDRFGPDLALWFLRRGERVPASLRVPYILGTYFDIFYADDMEPYPGDVTLVRSAFSDEFHADWQTLTEGAFEEISVDGIQILKSPLVDTVAGILRQRIEAAAAAE